MYGIHKRQSVRVISLRSVEKVTIWCKVDYRNLLVPKGSGMSSYFAGLLYRLGSPTTCTGSDFVTRKQATRLECSPSRRRSALLKIYKSHSLAKSIVFVFCKKHTVSHHVLLYFYVQFLPKRWEKEKNLANWGKKSMAKSGLGEP
uniref:Uncharacterized protein n=1 Tax=Schistocephalus solidus TaxID=70667 RepID=A0A0X3Q243_SCHSO